MTEARVKRIQLIMPYGKIGLLFELSKELQKQIKADTGDWDKLVISGRYANNIKFKMVIEL